MSGLGPRRTWVPDINAVADDLIADYIIDAERPDATEYDASGHALDTLNAWDARAKLHGEEWTENDSIALIVELARRAARVDGQAR